MRPLVRSNPIDSIETLYGIIERGEDLYFLDGETAFRRCGGTIETFDAYDELDAYGETLEDGGRP